MSCAGWIIELQVYLQFQYKRQNMILYKVQQLAIGSATYEYHDVNANYKL